MNDKLKNFAVKVIGMTDDEAAALFDADGNVTDDAFDVLTTKDKERIKRLRDEHKEDLTTKFNEGHAKAKREERTKYEQEIREAFGVESKAVGVDLIKDVLAVGSKDDVKTHPEYIALERKLNSEYIPKEDYDVLKSEHDQFKTQVQRDAMLGRVKNDAKSLFHSLNPVLSQDKRRAANQEAEFLKKFESFNFQIQDDGNHIILDSEGKRLTNENHNPVTFQGFVKDLTLSYFDVQEQPPAGSSGQTTPPSQGTSEVYKTKAEFYKAYSNEGDPEKAAKMYQTAKEAGLV